MIEKIQNLIEDNTSFDVTRNQIIMGLTVVVLLFLLIIIMMFGGGGSKKDPDNTKKAPLTTDASYLP